VAFHLDQGQPNYDGAPMKRFMDNLDIPSEIEGQDTYSRVLELTEEGRTYCSVCSRFRRAILYKAADRHGCNTVALGHHRDDLIETLLLNLFYSGQTKSMPPRLVNDRGTHELIRPLAYCREEDLAALAQLHEYEIMPCNLCGSQQTRRQYVKKWLGEMSKDQPHLKGNLLAALGNIQPSHMLDPTLNPLYPMNEKLKPADPLPSDHNSDGVIGQALLSALPNPAGSKSLPILNPQAP
jgi:tRNA 2-thiocytidine biosynthesis protein TtcA